MRLHATVVLLAATLPAQTPSHISPVAATTTLGNSNNNLPFSWSPNGYQQVHSASSFANSTPGVWTSMNMRMGNGFTNFTGRTIDMELFVAESPNAAASAVSTFASNVTPGSEINVFPRGSFNLPTVPNNNWVITFPFSAPFAWNGTAHVSWRASVYGNSNGNQFFVYPLDAFWNLGENTHHGANVGCRAATGTQQASHYTTIWSPGYSSSFNGNSYVATGGLPAVLFIGFDGGNWNGIPLPFDLTPAGAPGCFLGNSIADVVVGTTQANANGSVTLNYFVPADPSLAGGVFFSQYLFVDAGANALGLFTSNSERNVIGTPPQTTRIYAIGNPTGAGGTLERQFGMSVGFN